MFHDYGLEKYFTISDLKTFLPLLYFSEFENLLTTKFWTWKTFLDFGLSKFFTVSNFENLSPFYLGFNTFSRFYTKKTFHDFGLAKFMAIRD